MPQLDTVVPDSQYFLPIVIIDTPCYHGLDSDWCALPDLKETQMWKRLFILLILTIAAAMAGTNLLHAQGTWPPVMVDVKPIIGDDHLTFEIKVTNQVDWDLADFTLTGNIPAGTTFVEGHGDFDGATVSFDGQEVTFFVIMLPPGATLGYRYTVDLNNGTGQVYPPQMWTGWKGRLPGQFLFDTDREPIDLGATPVAEADGDDLDRAIGLEPTVIHVHGDAYEQGFERGQVLKREIKRQVAAQLENILPLAYNGDPEKWLEAIHSQITQVAPTVLEELRGMAEGSGVSLDDLEIVNFASYVTLPGAAPSNGSARSVVAATESATDSHTLIIGRHQTLNDLNTPPVFLVRHFNDTSPPRLELAQPASLQMLAAVTGNGLFWEGYNVASKEPVPAHATDMMSLSSEALRDARTVDELQQELIAKPRLKAMNMTIAELPRNEVSLLELSYTRHDVRQPDSDGVLISTDHFASPELEDLQPPSINQSSARYDRLLELAKSNWGIITPQMMQTFLHDPQIFHGTGISLVIDAANMEIFYWDEFRQEWLHISLPSLFAASTTAQ
jgi:hypothetical protein